MVTEFSEPKGKLNVKRLQAPGHAGYFVDEAITRNTVIDGHRPVNLT